MSGGRACHSLLDRSSDCGKNSAPKAVTHPVMKTKLALGNIWQDAKLHTPETWVPLFREVIELKPVGVENVDHFVQAFKAVRLAKIRGGAEFIGAFDVGGIV